MPGTVGSIAANARPVQARDPRGQQLMWRAMRFLKAGFTQRDLELHTGCARSTVCNYVRKLELAKYLRVAEENRSGQPGSLLVYLLIRDTGPLAPMIRASKSVFDANTGVEYSAVPAAGVPCLRQLAWESIRRGQPFTIPDLCDQSGISKRNAQKWILGLERAGILRRLCNEESGPAGGRSWGRFELAQDLGPTAPVVSRDGSIRHPAWLEVLHAG